MKKSVFEQELKVDGKLGSVGGKIIVSMNYEQENYTYTNPSTHDSEPRSRLIHKVEGFIRGGKYFEHNIIVTEAEVLKQVEICKEKIIKQMEVLANIEQPKSFVEKMQELGFKC